MRPPEQDLEDRTPVWDAMQMLFMDTDPTLFYADIARTCAGSKYNLQELEEILFNELLPAIRFNLYDPVGEWAGFEINGLIACILKRHRYGKRRPLFGRKFIAEDWAHVRPLIERERGRERSTP